MAEDLIIFLWDNVISFHFLCVCLYRYLHNINKILTQNSRWTVICTPPLKNRHCCFVFRGFYNTVKIDIIGKVYKKNKISILDTF